MSKVLITETVLRDAQQCLIQGRLKLQHVLPIGETLDSIGYEALDAWGGGTFTASVKLLQEDPWVRLRAIRGVVKKTPLQMLIRGQTLVVTQHQPDDVVRAFIESAVEAGISAVRMFDPLNDLRNLEVPIAAAKKAKARVIGALVYSPSPHQDHKQLAKAARRLRELGCHAIGIEDVAGILAPDPARELVRALREAAHLPISIHSHATTALAPITYFAAAEAGATSIDTALSALAWGSSQPGTETMVASFRDTPYDTRLDLKLIGQANRYFDDLHDEYEPYQDPISFRNDMTVLDHQLPTPVLADLTKTLQERNALDRYDRLLQELVRVRAETGYPPMAAPINQIVATQALANTLSERRYQVIEQSFRDYVKGLYGQPPGEIDRTVKQRALGGSEPITMRPADLLEPALDSARREMRRQGLPADSLDQVLLYVLFPDDAPGILRPEIRAAEPAPTPTPAAARSPEPEANAAASSASAEADTTREFTVEVDGEPYHVRVRGAAAVPATAAAAPSQRISADGLVQAPMQGMVIKVKVVPGAAVKLGDVVVVLEAMKMQNDIAATANGTVREVYVKEGTIVAANDPLLSIG